MCMSKLTKIMKKSQKFDDNQSEILKLPYDMRMQVWTKCWLDYLWKTAKKSDKSFIKLHVGTFTHSTMLFCMIIA